MLLPFTALALFLAPSVADVAANVATSDKPTYKAVGDVVVLSPGPVAGPIDIVLWKHGEDIAMECYKGSVDAFRQFKERGNLSGTTGELTITGLSPGDSGTYTVEINNKVVSTTQLKVIARVSKPTVSTQCDSDNTYCDFTCESSTTDAEPVTYSWKSHEKSWIERKNLRITREESAEQFHCELSNPVSTESSESVQNPLHKVTWNRSHTVLIICFMLLLFLVGGVIFYIYIRRNRKGDPAPSNYVSVPNVSSEAGIENDHEPLVNHVQTPTVPLDNREESEAPEGSSQDPASDVPSEPKPKDEVPGASTQEVTSDVAPESSSETGDPAPSNYVSVPNVSSEAGIENGHEPLVNHVQTPTVPLDNREESEAPEGSSQDQETATQNQKTVSSRDGSIKTEGSASVHETPDEGPNGAATGS